MELYIDALTHYGLKLYSWVNLQVERGSKRFQYVVLDPSYKYACACCVDGFYQQYLWSQGRDYVLRLGTYNPICRVPPEVEVSRQLERGVVGFVLSPDRHGFSLLDRKLDFIYEVVESGSMLLYLKGFSVREYSALRESYRFEKVLVPLRYFRGDLDELLGFGEVYFVTHRPRDDLPLSRQIYGSDSPYNGKGLWDSVSDPYNLDFYYRNFFELLARKGDR